MSVDPIEELFLKHPRAAGETYGQHLRFTLKYAGILLLLGLCLLVHGLVPKLFANMTSDKIKELNTVFQARRARQR
jgi:NADH:ubiquinone oxidoreductase subunit 4 (subunit M)